MNDKRYQVFCDSEFLCVQKGKFYGIEWEELVAENDLLLVGETLTKDRSPAAQRIASRSFGRDNFRLSGFIPHFEEHLIRLF